MGCRGSVAPSQYSHLEVPTNEELSSHDCDLLCFAFEEFRGDAGSLFGVIGENEEVKKFMFYFVVKELFPLACRVGKLLRNVYMRGTRAVALIDNTRVLPE